MSSKDNKKHMSAAKDTKGTVKRLLGYLVHIRSVLFL